MSLAEILNRQSMAGPRRRLVVEVLLCTVVGTTIVLAGVNATIDSRRYVSSPQYKSRVCILDHARLGVSASGLARGL